MTSNAGTGKVEASVGFGAAVRIVPILLSTTLEISSVLNS